MILIDKEQVTLDELSKKLGIELDIEKIIKRPVFDIAQRRLFKDPANGPNARKSRKGVDFPAHFVFRNAKGKSVEIRYATGRTPNPATEGRTELYAPRMLAFEGESELLAEDPDKAVFFFLHFYNLQSPCRQPDSKLPIEWEYVDSVAKANARIATIGKKREAMLLADTLEGDALMIVAKGLRIHGVSAMDELAVKAEVLEYAMNKPEEFITKANSQVNQIEGLIIDAIDKQIFVMGDEYGQKSWRWGMGTNEGETIVQFAPGLKDAQQSLISHIQQDINKYLPVLINMAKTINIKRDAEKQLENVDILSHFQKEKEAVVEDTTGKPDDNGRFGEEPPFPTDFPTSKDWVYYMTGKKTVATCAALNKAIQASTVNEENIIEWFELQEA